LGGKIKKISVIATVTIFSNSNAAKCNDLVHFLTLYLFLDKKSNIICLYFTSLLKRSKKNAVWAEKKVLFGKP